MMRMMMLLLTCPFCFLSLLLLLVCLNMCSVSATDSTYLGCFADKADTLQRSLPLLQEISSEMTVSKCLAKCASLGFAYTGLEYRLECYCSATPPKYEQLKEEQCSQTCGGGGEGLCGGALSLSVYKQSPAAPTFDLHRPLLCLVMILKNEAHTILATLRSVVNHIDCWTILDTGSTDGTQKVITDFFGQTKSDMLKANVPGELFEEPFIDYGATRSVGSWRSFSHARTASDFLLARPPLLPTQKPHPGPRQGSFQPHLHADVVCGRGDVEPRYHAHFPD
jgi:hypothetical protein